MFATVLMINRNGGAFLKQALETCRADLESTWQVRKDFELLIIDNGSTDDSMSTINRCLEGAPFTWRVEHEKTPGVNSARNAGIRHAQGELLIFVDSDLEFHPGWLNAYLDAAIAFPNVDVFAGRVKVGLVEGPVPDWLDLAGEWKRPAIVVQAEYGDQPRILPISREAGPVGPNMGFRRAVFALHGEFDTQFGLRPGSLVAGAEAEYFDRLMRRGVQFVWVPGAVVDHPLKKQQISRKYFLDRLHGIGRVSARVSWMRGDVCKRILGMTRYRIPELLRAIIAWMLVSLRGNPRQTFFYRGQISILAGYLREDFILWRTARR